MSHAIIVFDGVCNLCERAVQFVVRRDPRAYFRFVPSQSAAGKEVLLRHNLEAENPHSVVLIEDGRAFTDSTAALRIARRLHGAWPALYVLVILPKALRDLLYRWIARNRYKWFGKKNTCLVPTPELRDRFPADSPRQTY